jgi:hypothetical protein
MADFLHRLRHKFPKIPPTFSQISQNLSEALPDKLSHWIPLIEREVTETLAETLRHFGIGLGAPNSDDTNAEPPARFPTTIGEINQLPAAQKRAIYRTMLPDALLVELGINPDTLTQESQPLIYIACAESTRQVEISIWRAASDRDPLAYLHLADNDNNQIQVLLIQINNPDSPRYDTDLAADGSPTYFGTINRNLAAERAAMQAGLMPGQVRAGVSFLRRFFPSFDAFVTRMGQPMYFLEPLAYHNAILFERYGFDYVRGLAKMQAIHRDFAAGGPLQAQLRAGNPFRQPGAWQTIHGRSWAIHDGILGGHFTDVAMFKHIGQDAGISTAPDIAWR